MVAPVLVIPVVLVAPVAVVLVVANPTEQVAVTAVMVPMVDKVKAAQVRELRPENLVKKPEHYMLAVVVVLRDMDPAPVVKAVAVTED